MSDEIKLPPLPDYTVRGYLTETMMQDYARIAELEAALAEREQVRNDAVRSMRECEVRMRAAEQERDAAIKRAEAAKRDAERYQANGAAIIKRMCDACLLKLDAIAKEGER